MLEGEKDETQQCDFTYACLPVPQIRGGSIRNECDHHSEYAHHGDRVTDGGGQASGGAQAKAMREKQGEKLFGISLKFTPRGRSLRLRTHTGGARSNTSRAAVREEGNQGALVGCERRDGSC